MSTGNLPTTAFGVSFPNAVAAGPGRRSIPAFLEAVDCSALSSVWVQEQLLGRDASLEPLVALAYAAAHTSRVLLGTSAVIASLREPVLFAKQVSSLDQLSGGRLVLTVAIGGDDARIFEAVGVDVRERLPRLLDTIQAARALWSDESATYLGRYTHLDRAAMEPKPAQRPHPPIWFGGDADAALARAVALGSGWMGAGGSSTSSFAARVGRLEEMLAESGRDRADFTVAKKVYLAVDDRPDRAREGLERWFEHHWPSHMHPLERCREVAAWGSIDDLHDQIGAAVGAGADLVVLNPVFAELEQLPALLELVDRLSPTSTSATIQGGSR